jgi:hypothetical protein
MIYCANSPSPGRQAMRISGQKGESSPLVSAVDEYAERRAMAKMDACDIMKDYEGNVKPNTLLQHTMYNKTHNTALRHWRTRGAGM